MSLGAVTRSLVFGLAFCVSVVLLPRLASAQDRPAEISGGWSYVHESGESMPAGWYLSGARYVNSWFGIAGEVSGHYKTIIRSGVEQENDFHLFTAGPRFAYRRYPRFTPFLDLLVGARRARAAAGSLDSGANTSLTNFAYESIFGLTVNNGSGLLGVRISVGDYGIRTGDQWTNDTLFEAGVVIRP